MNPTRTASPASATTNERVSVLAGPGLALAATPALLLLSAPAPVTGAVWMLAILWTVLASLARALWLGAARGDWSGFGTACDEDDRARSDRFDADTRTGAYAYRRVRDNRETLTRNGDGAYG